MLLKGGFPKRQKKAWGNWSDLPEFAGINGMQPLPEQFDPLPVFKTGKQVFRQCIDAVACTKIGPAEECDGIGISSRCLRRP